MAEKIQFYNIARASCGEVRSLLYVIEDNFEGTRERAERLREVSGPVEYGSHSTGKRGCRALGEWVDREHATALDREGQRCGSSSDPDLLSPGYYLLIRLPHPLSIPRTQIFNLKCFTFCAFCFNFPT